MTQILSDDEIRDLVAHNLDKDLRYFTEGSGSADEGQNQSITLVELIKRSYRELVSLAKISDNEIIFVGCPLELEG